MVRPLFPACRWPPVTLSSRGHFSVHLQRGGSSLVSVFLLQEEGPIRLGLYLRASFNLYPLKGPICTYSHIRGLGFNLGFLQGGWAQFKAS